jgi:hypothetical protein
MKVDGEWRLVQNQSASSVVGAHFAADFSGNSSLLANVVALPSDGSARFDSPRIGYNTHFWVDRRGTYDAGTVDGVYVQMDLRTCATTKKL